MSAPILIALFFLYILGLTAFICARRMYWADEFLSWFLISDPSWHHAMQSWDLAIDSGGQLFHLVSRAIRFVTGLHPDVFRYTSTLCFALAAVVWYRLLQRSFGSWPSILAVGLVWFCNYDFNFHLGEARFYGPYLLGAVLCVATVLYVWQEDPPVWKAVLYSAVSGLCLLGSHLLGFTWLLLLVGIVIVFGNITRARLATIVTLLSSLLLIVPERQMFHVASTLTNWWMPRPTLRGVVRYYLQIVSVGPPSWIMVLNAILIAFILWALLGLFRNGGRPTSLPKIEQLFLTICIFFALMPIAFYLISQVRTPMFGGRYLMPMLLSASGLFAWSMHRFAAASRFSLSPVQRRITITASLVCVTALHWLTLRSVMPTYSSFENLTFINRIPGTTPVLLQELVLQEDIHLYEPQSTSQRFIGVYDDQAPINPAVSQGYWSFMHSRQDFLRNTPHFLYISTPWSHGIGFDEEFQSPEWKTTRLPDLTIYNRPFALYDVTRRQ